MTINLKYPLFYKTNVTEIENKKPNLSHIVKETDFDTKVREI